MRPDWIDPSRGVEITTPSVTLPKFVGQARAHTTRHR